MMSIVVGALKQKSCPVRVQVFLLVIVISLYRGTSVLVYRITTWCVSACNSSQHVAQHDRCCEGTEQPKVNLKCELPENVFHFRFLFLGLRRDLGPLREGPDPVDSWKRFGKCRAVTGFEEVLRASAVIQSVDSCIKWVPAVVFAVTPNRSLWRLVVGASAGASHSAFPGEAFQEADQERKHGQAEKHGSSVEHLDLAKVGHVGGVRAALAAVMGGGANGQNRTLSLFPVPAVVNSGWRRCP